MALTIAYERPIHRCLDALSDARPVPAALVEAARRRLLNEPFVTICADFGIWVVATLVWSLAWWLTDAPAFVFQQTFFNCMSIGLITMTLAFFLQEHILQKRLAPVIFPGGRAVRRAADPEDPDPRAPGRAAAGDQPDPARLGAGALLPDHRHGAATRRRCWAI